jgi:hypothetical protein
MSKKLYALTDAHRLLLPVVRDEWIANAVSAAPMTDEDRAITRLAIRGLYEAAGLTPPPDHRIVFVASPFIARFAAGFAAAIWWLRKNRKPTEAATAAATRAATDAATRDATRDATEAATTDATRDATAAATFAATFAATRDATFDATTAATTDATRDATEAATFAATFAATAGKEWYRVPMAAFTAAVRTVLGKDAAFGLSCAQYSWRMWNGGNQYSAWCSYLAFFRHVAHLPLDYSKWDHYETAALHSGPRLMHAEFCIVSDRPAVLLRDAQNRPHCESGPFCRWRDGSALYAWHGTRVPAWIIEHPETITAQSITAEPNAEIRRVMIARMGADRYVADLGVEPIQTIDTPLGPEMLYRIPRSEDSDLVLARVINSTPEPFGTEPSGDHVTQGTRWFKRYWLRVPPTEPTIATVAAAKAWSFSIPVNQYQLTAES